MPIWVSKSWKSQELEVLCPFGGRESGVCGGAVRVGWFTLVCTVLCPAPSSSTFIHVTTLSSTEKSWSVFSVKGTQSNCEVVPPENGCYPLKTGVLGGSLDFHFQPWWRNWYQPCIPIINSCEAGWDIWDIWAPRHWIVGNVRLWSLRWRSLGGEFHNHPALCENCPDGAKQRPGFLGAGEAG